jgi:MFS-type transporter involved in bile tolerance (Atg22 family)
MLQCSYVGVESGLFHGDIMPIQSLSNSLFTPSQATPTLCACVELTVTLPLLSRPHDSSVV